MGKPKLELAKGDESDNIAVLPKRTETLDDVCAALCAEFDAVRRGSSQPQSARAVFDGARCIHDNIRLRLKAMELTGVQFTKEQLMLEAPKAV